VSRTALVTGGAGFLGSHLCRALLADGRDVVCADNLGSGRRDNVATLTEDESFTFVEADIRDEPELPPADEVYHLASRASPTDFTSFPVRIALTNTEGTRYLLEHAVEHDARLLYASTSEVYGDPEVHPQPESYNGNVDIRGPRGCYDEAKRFGETLTVAYRKQYDLDVRTVRIFNTYGPRMRIDDGRVVPNFLTQALTGQDLTVYGDGSQTRSFCYVDDLIEGLQAVMNTEGLAGDVLNLGRPEETTIQRLAEVVVEECGTGSSITYEDLPEGDPKQRKPDISRARERLDWEPTTDLRTGLEHTIADFRQRLDD